MNKMFRRIEPGFEYCFNIETSRPLTTDEMATLRLILAETFEPEQFGERSLLDGTNRRIIEVGPRLNFETAFSTNAVAICHACGLTAITRLERSRRYVVPDGITDADFIAQRHDRMTECAYPNPLATFDSGAKPAQTYAIPLMEKGMAELIRVNREMGLSFDEQDMKFYFDLFVRVYQRNPTNVELFDLAQKNSEHSRHPFFRGHLMIDGMPVPRTLMQIIKSTLEANPGNSVIAFGDNSSAIKGYTVWTIIPEHPGTCSPFSRQQRTYHLVFTAETHNWPTLVACFAGAETGTGGRERDNNATGRGSLTVAATVGYAFGCLNLSDYHIPGEDRTFDYPPQYETPLSVITQGSYGAKDYGNKYGEPLIVGFCRSFGQRLPGGERCEYIKPILFTGGIGLISDTHLQKEAPEPGMLIVRIGGPAYRIGFGGGAMSSMASGVNQDLKLEFDSVQRGDAEMGQKTFRVIRACVELEADNPIASIHDQGAGGPSNVLSELVDPAGGRIHLDRITLGDQTLADVEIWCAEFQESYGLLIRANRIDDFRAICKREKVPCDVVGEITGDGRVVVVNDRTGSIPVDLELAKTLSGIPQKTFQLERIPRKLKPLAIPSNLGIAEALCDVLRLPSVGSKTNLTNKVDRSVTGLVGQQQCCGPLQLPVADYGVMAMSHFELVGGATSIGEQPIKMLVDPEAGARMSVAEALTNIVFARLSGLVDIKSSVNWMWAAKLPGEGARLVDAAQAMADTMITCGIAADGGKDSLSMSSMVGDELVKSPGTMVVSAYATMDDITKKVTPDIKMPGRSKLLYIDLGDGACRLGGSAFAQSLGQIGDECPDIEHPEMLVAMFQSIQRLISHGRILAGHDISDGGLITTLVEMALSGWCGLRIGLDDQRAALDQLFAEEAGAVIEYLPENEADVLHELTGLSVTILGHTTTERRIICRQGTENVLDVDTDTVLRWWEATSDRLELEQMDHRVAKQQTANHGKLPADYQLTFTPKKTPATILDRDDKPEVIILREEGSNGDREMTSAFHLAGFRPWDVTMTDLLNGRLTDFSRFRGMAIVGGFSYADVLDAGKGWAMSIRCNPTLLKMFDDFFTRTDTFSLGVCNGCQWMTLAGIVPLAGLPAEQQPRFIRNHSRRFDSRWVAVTIPESPAIMLQGMAGSTFGVPVAHGEGRAYFPDPEVMRHVIENGLAPLFYVDGDGQPTEQYPFNPNGSPGGIAGLCSPDGRHLAMMPHPERAFKLWQWHWLPSKLQGLDASPWLTMFQNAHSWCTQ